MEERLKIGLIVKPQGVRGELKVQPLTDDINRFARLKETIIDGKTYRVEKAVIGGNAAYITLSGINDRNAAETLRGKFTEVNREAAVPLTEGRYFIADIIGCTVVTDNDETVGEVVDVFSARTDIFTVSTVDKRVMRFPFLKDLIVDIDTEKKRVVVKEKRLKEVSVYED